MSEPGARNEPAAGPGTPSAGAPAQPLAGGAAGATGAAGTADNAVTAGAADAPAEESSSAATPASSFAFNRAATATVATQAAERERRQAETLSDISLAQRAAPALPAASGGGYSLRTLLILLVLAVLLPFTAILAYLTLHAARVETERANQAVVNLVDLTATEASNSIAEMHRLAGFLAARPQVAALDPKNCDPYMAQLLKLSPDLANIATVDANGQSICTVLKPQGNTGLPNIGQPRWLRELKRGADFALGTPQLGVYSSRWIIVLAVPLREDGVLKGAVEVVVNMEAFKPLVSTKVPEAGVVGITDLDGNIIARMPRPEEYVGKNLRGTYVSRMIISRRQGTGRATSLEGVERFYAFRPIGESGWIAFAGLPTADIYAQAKHNAWIAGGLSLAVLGVAALLVFAVQRRISAPMRALTETARRVANGEFSQRAPREGPREVAEVAAGFNHMLDQIPLMQSALRASEARYRSLVDAAPEAMMVHRAGRVLLVNAAAVRLYGAESAEQMIGMPSLALVHPDWHEASRQRARDVLTRDTLPTSMEQRHVRPADGSIIEVESVAVRVDYQGESAVLVLVHDIGPRKAAERRVARLSNLYEALSKTSAAIIHESDPQVLCGKVCEIAVTHGHLISAAIRMVDPAGALLQPYAGHGPRLGRIGASAVRLDDPTSPAARVAREGGYYVSNDIANDPRASIAREDAGQTGVRAGASFSLTDGLELLGTFSVFASEAGFFDPELTALLDEMSRNLAFALAKKRGEAALQNSEERYRALFQASPDAIRIICDERVVLINPAGVRLFGLASAQGMVGQLVYDTIDPAYRELAMERIRVVIDERKPVPPSEQVLLRGDGSRVDVEVVTIPFEYEGRPAALSIVHDLTARKAVERATLRLNQELEGRVQRRTAELKQANADLEAFSYTVAHDLRAPLRRMTGFTGLLRENLAGKLDEEEKVFMERVAEGGAIMDRLIEGLLALAHIGRSELKPERVDLSALARAVAVELHEREPQRRVEFSITPGLTAHADPRLLEDVLDNLIGNAWKFTSAHATAFIEFGALPAGTPPPCATGEPLAANGPLASSETDHAAYRCYYVRDDGAGFDEKYVGKLFGTFQRLHADGDFPGTGIGLASVKRIIAHHGGTVCAEGAVERGATFYFTLPVLAGEAGEGKGGGA